MTSKDMSSLIASDMPAHIEVNNPPISCYLRTKNEKRMVSEVVAAAFQIAREVVIVDCGSTDDTVAKAQAAGARVHYVPWQGKGKQKRAAEALCNYRYHLDLDCDEIVTASLAEEIKALFRTDIMAGRVAALRLVTAPPIGEPWGNVDQDYRNKLYDSEAYQMPNSEAWDQLQLDKSIQPVKLKAPLLHYSFADIGALLKKIEGNMSQAANYQKLKSKPYLILRIFLGLPIYFLKRYLLKGLFLKGVYGFSFAMTTAIGRWLKDVKMYERHHFGSHDTSD